jgi:hypothetical protein
VGGGGTACCTGTAHDAPRRESPAVHLALRGLAMTLRGLAMALRGLPTASSRPALQIGRAFPDVS